MARPRGEPPMEYAGGEIVQMHAQLHVHKHALEQLKAQSNLSPEAVSKIQELLNQCTGLETQMGVSGFSNNKMAKGVVRSVLKDIGKEVRVLASKKDGAEAKKDLPVKTLSADQSENLEKPYNDRLENMQEKFRLLKDQLAEVERLYGGTDDPEFRNFISKLPELYKTLVMVRTAFTNKKWNIFNNKCREAEKSMEQLHTEMDALKLKKKTPEPRGETGADKPHQSDAEKSENRIEKRKKAEHKLVILLAVRDEMMGEKQKVKIAGWVSDIERCLNDIARTNDIEVYDKKIQAIERYFGKIEAKLSPPVRTEFESRVAGNPASQEFITQEQKSLRLQYRDELARLKDSLTQKQAAPDVQERLDDLDVKIGNARLSHIRNRVDMANALAAIKTDLDNLTTEIQALPAKVEVVPPEPISDKQRAEIASYKSGISIMEGRLSAKQSTPDIDRRVNEYKTKISDAELCTDATDLAVKLGELGTLLNGLLPDIDNLPAASDARASNEPTEDQRKLLAQYRAELEDLKKKLAKRVSTTKLDDQVVKIEERIKQIEGVTDKDKLNKFLLHLEKFITALSKIIEKLPMKGGKDEVPSLLISDAQKDKIENVIPLKFKWLSEHLDSEVVLASLKPKLQTIANKIRSTPSTDGKKLDALLDEIIQDINNLNQEANLLSDGDYFSKLEARLEKKISTPAIDGQMKDLRKKIKDAEGCTDYGVLKGLVREIGDILRGQLVDNISLLPERKTDAQTQYLADLNADLQNLRSYFPERVGAEALETRIAEVEAKITLAEKLESKDDLEMKTSEISGELRALYDDFNALPTPEQSTENRLEAYKRDFYLLAGIINDFGGGRMEKRLRGHYIGVSGAFREMENLLVTPGVEAIKIVEAIDSTKGKLKNFIDVVKQDNEEVYAKFQEALKKQSPTSDFIDASVVVPEEQKGFLARAVGWFGFGKKKPSGATPPPDSSAEPKKGILSRIKEAVINKETGKFSAKLAYTSLTSVLGIKLITDGILAIGGKGDLAEYYRGTKESKTAIKSIMEAYQKFSASLEKVKGNEAGLQDAEIRSQLTSLEARVRGNRAISDETKQKILDTIETIAERHFAGTGKAKEERDADVKRLLEAYIHAKVSGAQIAKDGLNTLLTAFGGAGLRALGYAGASVVERIQKARKEHTRRNVGQLEEKSAFGFVAKDVTIGAVRETIRSLRFAGAKEGATGRQKFMDFAKAAGILFRAFGIYGSALSGNTEKNIDTLIERIKSGNVLRVDENFADTFRSVWETYRHPVETVEKMGHKIKMMAGGSEKSTGQLEEAWGHMKQSPADSLASPEPGHAPLPTPEPIAPVPAPEAPMHLSPVQELGSGHQLDVKFYPHLEKITKDFPELNNNDSLAHILAAEKAGTGIRSHHTNFIKHEINTMVESGAERQQVIFEEILKNGGPARAAEYLQKLHFSHEELKHIAHYVGKGSSDKVNWKEFAELYKKNMGSDKRLVEGLWKTMQGKETQIVMNAGLAGKGVDSHIHGQIYYGGLDEHGRPIISAVEGHDGYISKDQMGINRRLLHEAGHARAAFKTPTAEPLLDKQGHPILDKNGNALHSHLEHAVSEHLHPVREKTIKIRTLETFKPSGQVLGNAFFENKGGGGGGGATSAGLSIADADRDALGNAFKSTVDSLASAGRNASEFGQGIARDFGSVIPDTNTGATGNVIDTISAGAHKAGESVKGIVKGARSVFETKNTQGSAGGSGKVVEPTPQTNSESEQTIAQLRAENQYLKLVHETEVRDDISNDVVSRFGNIPKGTRELLEQEIDKEPVMKDYTNYIKLVQEAHGNGQPIDSVPVPFNIKEIKDLINAYDRHDPDWYKNFHSKELQIAFNPNFNHEALANGGRIAQVWDEATKSPRFLIKEGHTFEMQDDDLVMKNDSNGQIVARWENPQDATVAVNTAVAR